MAFASASLAQRQAVRDSVINLDKAVQKAHDTGPLDTQGPAVDTLAAAVVAALDAAGTGSGGTASVVVSGDAVTVPITFTTARTAGQTATVQATITVANGAISKIVIA